MEADLPTVQVSAEADMPDAGTQALDLDAAQRRLARDMQDLLRGEPAVQSGTGTRNGQKIFLRGLDDVNVLVQLDGARQGANLLHHQARVGVDPFLLKRVRLTTGPAPADAGPAALGGAIAFETVDAHDLLRPGQRHGARLAALGDSADRTRGILGSAWTVTDQGLGLLAYTRRELSDRIRAGNGSRLPGTEGDLTTALLKATVLEADGHTLRLSWERWRNDGGYFRANFPWDSNNAIQAWDDQRQQRDTFSVRHRYQDRARGWLDVQTSLYHNLSRLELWGRPPLAATLGDDWRTRSLGWDVRNTARWSLGGWLHELTVGVDRFDDRNQASGWAIPTLRESARNTGVYVQDRVDGGALRLSFGARWDRWHTTYANGYGVRGQRTSPNASLEWDVAPTDPARGDTWTLFAGVGESVRGAKLNQAAWLTKYFLPPRYTTPRPFILGRDGVLRPEVARQQQAGLRVHTHGLWTAGDHAGLQVQRYRIRLRDYQIIPGEGPTAPTDRIVNAPGDIVSQGWELRAHWGNARWHVEGSWSRPRVRNYDGQPLDTTGESARVGVSTGPRLTLDVQHRWSEAWTLGYQLTAVGRLREAPAGRPPKPGYAVHGLQAIWQPHADGRFRLTLAVDNLTDKLYAEHASVRLRLPDGRETAMPEPGRSVRVLADWRF
ncbi:TonB-dependent receptor plug domain-containing protein [Tepidimonas alkaliphilus]|nr:TonB-dependent receptor plug domain-containing protein [Tepidimonas alkaliphilus]